MTVILLIVCLIFYGANTIAADAASTPPATNESTSAKAKTKKPASKTETGQVEASGQEGERELGMSIIGSRDLPKVLYIVPWKSPEPAGEMPFASRVLDEVFQPIEPEVFERTINFRQQMETKPAASGSDNESP